MATERESGVAAAMRKAKLVRLQEHYDTFGVFLDDVMDLLGFDASEQQHDIGDYLSNGPGLLMVQAQRSQAKSTITVAYVVWFLIHNPSARILIVSAADELAGNMSNMIINIMRTMPQLECMLPDKSAGDRTAGDGFDIHHTLKGVDKDPSVSCAGITGTLVGKRADLLVADDIESPKNSRTAPNRELLMHLTREFTSLCSGKKDSKTGKYIIEPRIVYLGTPQSSDSVYNTLPARGFAVRIWPGRFPTTEEEKTYGDMLAPSILQRMANRPDLRTGCGPNMNQGAPTDSMIVNEHELTKKHVSEGPAYFQLQYMLCTQLADAQRYPLKTENLLVMRCNRDKMPMSITRSTSVAAQVPYKSGNFSFTMSQPHGTSDDFGELQGCVMYVDPAGGGKNGDENGYAVTGFLNGNIYVLDAGGLPGGYSVPGLEKLAEIAQKWRITHLFVEKNMGYGAFREVWMPILRKYWDGVIQDDMVYGQKETRIIATLEPIIARGALIINHAIVESDDQSLQKYDGTRRGTYSLFHQLSKITREAGCLFHDDRLDALEGAVRYWVPFLTVDEDKAALLKKAQALKDHIKDPFGKKRFTSGVPTARPGILNRFRR